MSQQGADDRPEPAPESATAQSPRTVVTVRGETEVTVPIPPADGEWPERTVSASLDCESKGELLAGQWTGVPVTALLDRAAVPGTTTHLTVAGDDGHTVCVDVRNALNGIVAYRLGTESLPADRVRFVAPGVSGLRYVRNVAAIESVTLDAGADRTEYESFGEDDE